MRISIHSDNCIHGRMDAQQLYSAQQLFIMKSAEQKKIKLICILPTITILHCTHFWSLLGHNTNICMYVYVLVYVLREMCFQNCFIPVILSLLVEKILHSHFTESGLSQEKSCFSDICMYMYKKRVWVCFGIVVEQSWEKMQARAKYCWQMWNITMDCVFDVHIYYPAEKAIPTFRSHTHKHTHTHIFFTYTWVLCIKLYLTIVSSEPIYIT